MLKAGNNNRTFWECELLCRIFNIAARTYRRTHRFRKQIVQFLFLFSFSVMGTALFLTFTRSSYLAILITIPLMLFSIVKALQISLVKDSTRG